MAAAGVDASNTGDLDGVLLLPDDPDGVCARSSRTLQAAGVERLGVVLSDTAGRPWRVGQIDFALGAAGLRVVDDLRGGVDADGRPLAVTARAVADEIAAAADLVKGKAAAVPVAVVRGRRRVRDRCGGARRWTGPGPDRPGDWFATGEAEAIRSALGVTPGSELAERVGIAGLDVETPAVRVGRAVAVALSAEDLDEGVGVDVGLDEVVVTGGDPVDRGMLADRIRVALWGEGFATSVDAAPQRHADAVRVRIRER